MEYYLAFDAGATHTRALFTDNVGKILYEAESGPCNPSEYGMDFAITALVTLGQGILARFPDATGKPLMTLAGVSGLVRQDQAQTLAEALCAQLPCAEARATTDLHPVLYANAGNEAGILIVAGTGAAVLAKEAFGVPVRLGGRGHVMGDEGSAYHVAVEALRALARAEDAREAPGMLAEALLNAAGIHTMNELAAWSASAAKHEIAALAGPVLDCAQQHDATAMWAVHKQATALAALASAAYKHLALPAGTPVYLHGGLFERSSYYSREVAVVLAKYFSGMSAVPAPVSGARALLVLRESTKAFRWMHIAKCGEKTVQKAAALPITEQSNASGPPLDTLDALGIVLRMNDEDARLPGAVRAQAGPIAQTVQAAATALETGGRIVYVGAGTSGRLGVLDASECPPTFGVAPGRVVGVIAGGETALRNSVEGEEDNTGHASADMAALGIGPNDVVIGIAASGGTPYVHAALRHAAGKGAKTALVSCNPKPPADVDFPILLNTGPEALTGSTRLKAGTATKMVLNTITTGAMALAGYVYHGRMVCMRPVNAKLRQRAVRIVTETAGVTPETAQRLLDETDYKLPLACLMSLTGASREDAAAALGNAGGSLKKALASLRPNS